MSEEKIESRKETKEKLVWIPIVRRGKADGGSVLVFVAAELNDVAAYYVPEEMIEGDKISSLVLEKCVPHGVPWDEALAKFELDKEGLARALRQYSIWTYEDMETRVNALYRAVMKGSGISDALLTAARKYELRKE